MAGRGAARNSKNRTRTQAIVKDTGDLGLDYLLEEMKIYTAQPGKHKEVIEILKALKVLAPQALRTAQKDPAREGAYRDPPQVEGAG